MSQDPTDAHDGADDATSTTDATGPRLTRRRAIAAGGASLAALSLGASSVLGQQQERTMAFTVSLENVSDGSTLATSADGEAAEQPVPLSPGAWAVHTRDEPIFSRGEMERGNGLEEVAEDGRPGRLAEHLAGRETVVASGPFTTPVGADGPGPLTPGHRYEFEFEASTGRPRLYLSMVTMFVPSNDLFYALGGSHGVPVFRQMGDGDGMAPLSGDATGHVDLWDAGTEVNQEPGVGDDQVQRQRAAGVGDVERGTVAPIAAVNGYDYPPTEDVLRLTVTPSGDN